MIARRLLRSNAPAQVIIHIPSALYSSYVDAKQKKGRTIPRCSPLQGKRGHRVANSHFPLPLTCL
jgi:hypothetical protein